MSAYPLAIFLMGPTATGKTALALELVSRFPCDIISVDSTQVYQGLDIGSAKPGPEILARAPHRLIDILDPAEAYSAARFRADALREMAAISARGRVPLLVGGTGLYFRALTQGLSPLPAADPAIRARLEAEAAVTGWGELHRRLAAVDPAAAARIHPNDPQRIQRALEVFEITGRPLSELQRQADAGLSHGLGIGNDSGTGDYSGIGNDFGTGDGAGNSTETGAGNGTGSNTRTGAGFAVATAAGALQGCEPLPYRVLKLVRLPRDRAVLGERIHQRFHAMLAQGFEAEVRRLWARGDLTPDLPALRSVGYRQMLNYLLGAASYTEAIERGVIATRQLAKRQMTWLRAETDCQFLFDDEAPTARALALVSQALG